MPTGELAQGFGGVRQTTSSSSYPTTKMSDQDKDPLRLKLWHSLSLPAESVKQPTPSARLQRHVLLLSQQEPWHSLASSGIS